MGTTTNAVEDIRIAASRLGSIAFGYNEDCPIDQAYRILASPAYKSHGLAVRVFKALEAREWGVAAAFADGLKGGVVAGLNGQ